MINLKTLRWNRIFAADGKTVIVAMDHAGAFGVMKGLEDPGAAIRQVAAGGADAILTTYGVSTRFADAFGRLGLILRCDGGTSHMTKERKAMQLSFDAYDALRLGADAVGIMSMPGSQYDTENAAYLAELVSQCAEWNIPVLAEALPAGFENPKEWWTPQNLANACRLSVEMGVDFIKTAYTGDTETFRQVVQGVYTPVVVLGGAKGDDPRELLANIHGAMQAGACGVAVGRNIYQYAQPAKMTAAIAAIVHGGASVEEALRELK
jgi:DhnA family fructose-bisphosphate aldolase class Ia